MRVNLGRIITGLVLVCLAIAPAYLIIATQIQYSHIEESEAVTVTAHYSMHEERIRGKSSYLLVSFLDHDPLEVHWNNVEVANNLNEVDAGEMLSIKVHPKCGRIMSIRSGGLTLCDFNDTLKAMDAERRIFLIIGLGMYVLYVVLYLISAEGQKFIKKYRKQMFRRFSKRG